jgi:hypothetical protein
MEFCDHSLCRTISRTPRTAFQWCLIYPRTSLNSCACSQRSCTQRNRRGVSFIWSGIGLGWGRYHRTRYEDHRGAPISACLTRSKGESMQGCREIGHAPQWPASRHSRVETGYPRYTRLGTSGASHGRTCAKSRYYTSQPASSSCPRNLAGANKRRHQSPRFGTLLHFLLDRLG